MCTVLSQQVASLCSAIKKKKRDFVYLDKLCAVEHSYEKAFLSFSQCFFHVFAKHELLSDEQSFSTGATTQNSLSTQLGISHACVGKPTGSPFFRFYCESYLCSPNTCSNRNPPPPTTTTTTTFTSSKRHAW